MKFEVHSITNCVILCLAILVQTLAYHSRDVCNRHYWKWVMWPWPRRL